MNCKNTIALIADWIDGALDTAQARALERHTRACPDCAQAVRRHRDLVAMLDELPLTTEQAPAGFADRVISRLKAAGHIREAAPVLTATPQPSSWLPVPWRIPVFAALLLLVGLALFPATIEPLTGIAGKGAVVATDAYVAVRGTVVDADLLTRAGESLQRNLRTLWAVLQAGFALLAKAGEALLLPLLAVTVLMAAVVVVFIRSLVRRGARASYSF